MNRKIGLIPGTGKQSKGIALRLGLAGYEVMLGSRTLEKAEKSAEELNKILQSTHFTCGSNVDVVKKCNLIFFVIPYQYIENTLSDLKNHFQEKTILVDVIVPLKFDGGYATCDKKIERNSISEVLQTMLPEKVSIVGGFKTISASILNNIEKPLSVDVFLTSDDEEAKKELQKILVKIEGLRVLDAGPLQFSHTTEQMTAFVINLNRLNKLHHASYKMISSSKE